MNWLPDPTPGDRSVGNCILYCLKKDPVASKMVADWEVIAGPYAIVVLFDILDERLLKKYGSKLAQKAAGIAAKRAPPIVAAYTLVVVGVVGACTTDCANGGNGP